MREIVAKDLRIDDHVFLVAGHPMKVVEIKKIGSKTLAVRFEKEGFFRFGIREKVHVR